MPRDDGRRGGAEAPAPGPDPAAPVHLLVGEESFLRERRARELVARLRPRDNPEYNQEAYSGPEVDLDRVVAACETLPVFAERRLVIVRNLVLAEAAASAAFVAYLRRPNPTTLLLLTAEGAGERRGRGEGDEGAAAARGRRRGAIPVRELLALVPSREEFPVLRPDGAAEFVREAARARRVEVDADAVRLLVELVGTDAARLDDEVEKAALYAAGPRIGAAHVEALARRTREHGLFELTDALAAGSAERVLVHLGALLEDGHEPVLLLGMVAWHLRRTLRGAALLEEGARPGDAARALGVHFRVVDRFAASCRKLGTTGAARAVAALRLADRALKSSPADSRQVLERALLELVPRATPAG